MLVAKAKLTMNRKLLFMTKLLPFSGAFLRMRTRESLRHYLRSIYEFIVPKGIIRQGSFLMLFLLFSLTSSAQLALENFEAGIPATWDAGYSNVGTAAWTTSTNGYLSSGAAFLDPTSDNIGNGNTARYYLITPLVEIPANGQLRFYTKQGDLISHGTEFEIRLSTASQPDISGFTTVLETWTESTLTTTSGYEEKTVTIPGTIAPGVEVFIAFVLVNHQTATTPTVDTWLIDNVQLQTAQVCDPVLAANFTADPIGTQTATLSWTHPTATNFEIQVLPAGQVPGVNGIATDNSYPAGGLTEGTPYDVYIKALCSESTSIWAGPFSFTTVQAGIDCAGAIPVGNLATPYTTTDNLIDYLNPDIDLPTQGQNCIPFTNNYASGDKAFYTYTPTANGIIRITFTSTEGYTGVFVYEGCTNVGVECVGGDAGTDNTPRIIDLVVEVGTEYIIMLSSNYGPGADIPYTLTIEQVTCPVPTGITASSVLQTSFNLSWNNLANAATSWQVAVQPVGTGVPSGTGVTANTNTNFPVNATLGGAALAAGTAYEVYVRAACGAGFSAWSLVSNVTTQCAVFPTPYSESFDGAMASTPTPCWTPVDINADGAKWSFSWENASMYTGDTTGNNDDLMSTPMINLGTTPKRLKFKYQTVNGVSRFAVVLSTTGIGGENFTTVLLPMDTYDTNYELVEKIVNIPTSITGNVNIAWYISPGADETATRFSIDDVIVEDKPACSDPVALTATDITTTSAQLSWEAGDAEGQWQIVVQAAGSGVPTGTGELVSSNTYNTAQPLTHATQYEYYVRAYCSSTSQSNWVGPFAFTTLCATFDVPFYESFNDDDVNTHKFCWVMMDENGDGAQWNMNATEPAIQGNPWFGTPDYNDWLISPAINVIGTKALKFKYKSAFSFFFPNPRFGVEVLMSTTDTNPASFTVVGPLFEFTNTDYIEKTVYINANGPVYIAFRVPPSFSTAEGTSILQIDDVIIEDAPACPAPSELTATSITQTTAVLSWTAGYQETQWEIKVQPAGTGVPTANGELTSNNTTYPAGPLLANTQYEYYVRAYCSATEKSEWIGPFVFTTLCNVFPTPFIETFENDSASEECWRVINGNSDSYTWNLNSTTNPYEGEHSAGMFTGSNGNNDDWLISPTITVGPNQRLKYYYRVFSSFFEEDLEVRLSTTGVEPASFTTELYNTDTDPNPLNNEQWKEKIINLPEGTVGNINIAWHIPQEEPSWMGYRGQILIIDRVIIEDIPGCPDPSNLFVTNIADVTADIHWDVNGTESAWEVYVQPAGLPSPTDNIDPQYLFSANGIPYTASGLTPASQYEFYVRADCGTEAYSEWVGPIPFTTMCSFENLCEYTITLTNPAPWGDISGSINLVQNEVTTSIMELTNQTEDGSTQDFIVYLCDGVEFSLYWNSIGWAPGIGGDSTVTIKNQSGDVVWNSPVGIGTPLTTIYEGISSCSVITCPAPTNLTINPTGVLSWTAGGSETQWEVYIQPLNNGTLPQSGTLVSTTSYTPQASDFVNLAAGTYEFFVRAICGQDDNSYWSGPFEFVRNDDATNAIKLPVNSGEVCEQSGTAVTFTGATPSSEPMTCNGANQGDVWFEFEAASKVHTIELGNFSGDLSTGYGAPIYPKVTMTLYKVVGTTLQEMACSYNNAIVAAYTSELEIGATYKVRLTINDGDPAAYTFDVCVKTPLDPCKLDAVNSGLENPEAATGGLTNFFTHRVVPGWRNNFPETEELDEVVFFIDALNTIGVIPYEGGQSVQLITGEAPQDPSDLTNILGMYQDFDSSEITKYDYSYAHAARGQDSYLQLYAGPPSGPFVLLEEHVGTIAWNVHEGEYVVPAGQTVTRFIFRSKDNMIGNLLDAAHFVANNELITEDHTLSCQDTSVTLEAEGIGQWIADENNPAVVVIATPTEKTTEVTGFTAVGNYTFHWKTRYCDYTVVITNNGVVTPEVTSPVNYCVGQTAVPLTVPALEGYTIAWFTVPTGGTATTIAPTPDTSAEGTTSYYVAYVNAEGCEGPRAEIQVNVNTTQAAEVEFSYDNTAYCTVGNDPVMIPEANFTPGGTFTATPEGLSIDAATGAIDIAGSTPGVYTITYTIDGGEGICNLSGSHSFTLSIAGDLKTEIVADCREQNLWLVATPVNGSFDPLHVNYTWRNANGVIIGTEADFNVAEYFATASQELPLDFTVTVSTGDCSNEAGYTVTSVLCQIPRGISPNGDGDNDYLDLTGLGVIELNIFNRYGREVYKFEGNYTNQWHGQDRGNKELPDGTYFYSIHKSDGTSLTGWVYISRDY